MYSFALATLCAGVIGITWAEQSPRALPCSNQHPVSTRIRRPIRDAVLGSVDPHTRSKLLSHPLSTGSLHDLFNSEVLAIGVFFVK